MNNQKLKNYGFQELSVAEMSNTTGGFIPLIVLAAIAIGASSCAVQKSVVRTVPEDAFENDSVR